MNGLIDSPTGLDFGTGLQFETQIGTAGLIIELSPNSPAPLVWNAIPIVWDGLDLLWS